MSIRIRPATHDEVPALRQLTAELHWADPSKLTRPQSAAIQLAHLGVNALSAGRYLA